MSSLPMENLAARNQPAAPKEPNRLDGLEAKVEALEKQVKEPKPKDGWDKLSALSTLFSGVILGLIGVWVNYSLNTSQKRAQDAQSAATQTMERAHNQALEKQSADAFDFQKQQFEYSKQLELVKERLQTSQARDTLTLQREQNRAALELQRTQNEATNNLNQAQFARDLMPQMKADAQSRQVALQLMEKVNPLMSVMLAVTYSETSLDPNLKSVAAQTIARLESSSDPEVSKLAREAPGRIASAKRIQAIIEVFESRSVIPTYSEVFIMGDRLTYGRGYFSLASGDLLLLLRQYCERPSAQFSREMQAYLPQVEQKDDALVSDPGFKQLLRQAATDPVMQAVQDEQFDRMYWKPTTRKAETLGLTLPLSLAVLYDSTIQGGGRQTESATTQKLGGTPSTGVDEKQWISTYVDTRVNSLRSRQAHAVYRPETFRELIRQNRWELKGDLVVRGVQVPE